MKVSEIINKAEAEERDKETRQRAQTRIKKAIKRVGPKGVKNFVHRHSKETNPGDGETPYTPHPLSTEFISNMR